MQTTPSRGTLDIAGDAISTIDTINRTPRIKNISAEERLKSLITEAGKNRQVHALRAIANRIDSINSAYDFTNTMDELFNASKGTQLREDSVFLTNISRHTSGARKKEIEEILKILRESSDEVEIVFTQSATPSTDRHMSAAAAAPLSSSDIEKDSKAFFDSLLDSSTAPATGTTRTEMTGRKIDTTHASAAELSSSPASYMEVDDEYLDSLISSLTQSQERSYSGIVHSSKGDMSQVSADTLVASSSAAVASSGSPKDQILDLLIDDISNYASLDRDAKKQVYQKVTQIAESGEAYKLQRIADALEHATIPNGLLHAMSGTLFDNAKNTYLKSDVRFLGKLRTLSEDTSKLRTAIDDAISKAVDDSRITQSPSKKKEEDSSSSSAAASASSASASAAASASDDTLFDATESGTSSATSDSESDGDSTSETTSSALQQTPALEKQTQAPPQHTLQRRTTETHLESVTTTSTQPKRQDGPVSAAVKTATEWVNGKSISESALENYARLIGLYSEYSKSRENARYKFLWLVEQEAEQIALDFKPAYDVDILTAYDTLNEGKQVSSAESDPIITIARFNSLIGSVNGYRAEGAIGRARKYITDRNYQMANAALDTAMTYSLGFPQTEINRALIKTEEHSGNTWKFVSALTATDYGKKITELSEGGGLDVSTLVPIIEKLSKKSHSATTRAALLRAIELMIQNLSTPKVGRGGSPVSPSSSSSASPSSSSSAPSVLPPSSSALLLQ
jgi:hypothetical protein